MLTKIILNKTHRITDIRYCGCLILAGWYVQLEQWINSSINRRRQMGQVQKQTKTTQADVPSLLLYDKCMYE